MTAINQFVKARVDYVSILEALRQTSQQAADQYGPVARLQPGDFLIEYKVIGFLVGRQCGKSYCMLDWNRDNPGECLNIVKDNSLKRHFTDLAKNREGGGGMGPILCSDTLRKHAAKFKENKEEGIEGLKKIHAGPKYIIIDDSAIFFSYLGFKRREFFEFIAATYGTDLFVICLG